MMTGNIPIPEENVKFIVKDLTPERILRYIDVEDRLRGIDAEDIVQNLSDEEKKKLQKLLNGKVAAKLSESFQSGNNHPLHHRCASRVFRRGGIKYL